MRMRRVHKSLLPGLAVLCMRLAWAGDAEEVRALIAGGELGAALAQVQRAADANPRDAQLRFLEGVVLMDMGRDALAMRVFTELSQSYPELPDPFNNIALLHARAGQFEAAREALVTALRNDPGHPAARTNLAQVYLMLAVQALEQAAVAAPLDGPTRRQLEAARALLPTARRQP
jgi:Flp pilus assembly protein TadD